MSGLIRVAVRARGDEAEPVRARLLELAPAGLEERDADGAVELAVYLGWRRRMPSSRSSPGATSQPVEDGWEDAWRAFHQPALVGGLWLGPPWSVRRIRRVPS